jgi:putative membrane protein
MMHWGYGSGWGFALMAVSMVVFWGLVIGAIVLIVRATSGTPGAGSPPPAAGPGPQQILAERFARGEIDEQEYHSRLATLRGSPTPGR